MGLESSNETSREVPHLQKFNELQINLIARYGLRLSINTAEHNAASLAWIRNGLAERFAEFQKNNPDLDFTSLDDTAQEQILDNLMENKQ